jgi:hypothetical protein
MFRGFTHFLSRAPVAFHRLVDGDSRPTSDLRDIGVLQDRCVVARQAFNLKPVANKPLPLDFGRFMKPVRARPGTY